MSEWTFNGEPFIEAPKGYEGFVYLIAELDTGRKYIGKKFFFTRRKPAKTKKNADTKRRRVTKEGDWRNYWSSSDIIKESVAEKGEDNYTREILVICKTMGDTNYMEIKMLYEYNVLENVDYINESIGPRRGAPQDTIDARRYST